MLVTKINGTKYSLLSHEIIRFHIDNRWSIAYITRELSYRQTPPYDFIDDINDEEVSLGTNEVRSYSIKNDCIDLYYEYVLATSDSEIEKLNIYKDMKKAEIESSKNESISKTVELKDKRFKPNDGDISLINSILSTYSETKELPSDFKWISEDNEQVELTYDELKSLGESYLNNLTNSTIRARVLKDLIIKAKTKEQLDNIRWEE